MLKQAALIDIEQGTKVELFLLVTGSEIKRTRTNKDYLDLTLRDKSTQINAKIWDYSESSYGLISEGDIIKVAALVEVFNDQKQLKIEKLRSARKEDKVFIEDFLPTSQRDLEEMTSELQNFINSINNEYLSPLLQKIFSEESYEKFIRVPAGKAWHHSYIHGLLEHTLEIAKICDTMCRFHKQLDRDLLICGALLHDFGKTEELSFDTGFDYTEKGRLLGHIVIASLEIEKAARTIMNFPEKLLNKLLHLVLSHQGKLEQASPVIPKTIEAIALYHADELSAQTNAYIQACNEDKNNESGWTRFLPIAGTSLKIPELDNKIKNTLFD